MCNDSKDHRKTKIAPTIPISGIWLRTEQLGLITESGHLLNVKICSPIIIIMIVMSVISRNNSASLTNRGFQVGGREVEKGPTICHGITIY